MVLISLNDNIINSNTLIKMINSIKLRELFAMDDLVGCSPNTDLTTPVFSNVFCQSSDIV